MATSATLSKAFHQRHGTSPMRFLKQRRLQAVQRALLAADPGSTTVTDVAMRFGFFHLSQFAADYRQALQELPSETLRR
jgi:AraC-like DNA-binding protein